MNIDELLINIEKRPQMYFREKNIYFMEAFLGGWFINEYLKNKDFRSNFYDWLQKKYIIENDLTWADFINILSKNENLNSVDVFFREYHLFKEEQ